ncbi:MAG TPA: phosphotransferase [Nitrospiraceae bacterium]|jgi:aminoglycoside/choline kinase family phosphotransferase|nr:phosphotransferase [Nitrospiraceae bacterium]
MEKNTVQVIPDDKVGLKRYNPYLMTAAVPAPPDRDLVAETVRSKLSFRSTLVSLFPLTGDASNRRYFRLDLDGASPRSLVLMQLASPEAFKQSEEAVSRSKTHIAELPFINILNHLMKADVSVPSLHYYDAAAGLLYLEDFGDLTLAEACRTASSDRVRNFYRQAIDTLVGIHTRATEPPNAGCIAFGRSFDVPLLMWEFDHFLEYGIAARQDTPMGDGGCQAVRREFEHIAKELAALPRVFTHRDYHSRNLMVDGTRLGVIDFQDALMGPAVYDLASLLRDAYIALDEALIDEAIRQYVRLMAEHGQRMPGVETFRRQFDLMSIQRNLKAAGRFVYIDRVKHNPKFLADIPRVLGYVKRNLAKYPELATLRQHLTPYVPELQ